MQIIHGADQVASRNYLQTLKKDQSVLEFSAGDLTISKLDELLKTSSLFGPAYLVIIYGPFSARQSNAKKELISYLSSNIKANVIIWEDDDVTLSLKNLPASLIKNFPLPKHLFHFLDNLTLATYRQALSSAEPELIFAMFTKHLRKLILLHHHELALPDWQLAKLKPQLTRFPLPKLLVMYYKLLDLDFAAKTSSSPMNLSDSLEVLLATS